MYIRPPPVAQPCPSAIHLALGVLLLAATAASDAATPPPRVAVAGDTVTYAGLLTADGFATLRAAADGIALTWLAITSGGGEVNVAMDFGEWVADRGLGVRVVDRCFSSCANYVFPAGLVKVIEPGAVVAWHGSALRDAVSSERDITRVIDRDVLPRVDADDRNALRTRILDDTLDYLERARERQRRFFGRLGVDGRITRLGEGRPGVRDFWFLSVESMARFGIDRVVAPSDYPATDTRRFGPGRVTYIELDAAGRPVDDAPDTPP